MFIELVDSLRCSSSHEQTWLVASVTRLDGRDIVEGRLGCPVCKRQFEIRAGEADFTDEARGSAPNALAGSASGSGPLDDPVGSGDGSPESEDERLRARALLGLAEGGGVVLLGGERAAWADVLEDEAQVLPLLLNTPRSVTRRGRPPSAVRTTESVPLAPGVLRAAWLDAATASPAMLDAVVRALRVGGRLVAPAHALVPAGARELARDAHEWVAECVSAAGSAPVPLRRR